MISQNCFGDHLGVGPSPLDSHSCPYYKGDQSLLLALDFAGLEVALPLYPESYGSGSRSRPLAGTVSAIHVCFACFVGVRISVRLFWIYSSVFIVVRGTFATKENHHLFPKERWMRSRHLLKARVWGSSWKLAVRSTGKGTGRGTGTVSSKPLPSSSVRLLTAPIILPRVSPTSVPEMPLCAEWPSLPHCQGGPSSDLPCGT